MPAPPLSPLPEGRLLLGISGGLDSVSLLHALLAAGRRNLVLAHLDHRLRGRASTADAAFVQRLARKHDLALILERLDVQAVADAERLSVETAARQVRYSFFARASRQARCRNLLLAQHADDQAETFLFNLLRGGGTGLGGMRQVTRRKVDGVTLAIHRPWLRVTRAAIEAYACAEKIRHRHDASNDSPGHTRNRLRHLVIPFLCEEFGRDIRPALWRAAEVLAAQQEFLDHSLTLTGDTLPARDLRLLPEALQRHTIHAWLRRHEIPQVSFALVESIRTQLLPTSSKLAKVNLPGGLHARRRAGVLFIEKW